jgi:hypothetical protein
MSAKRDDFSRRARPLGLGPPASPTDHDADTLEMGINEGRELGLSGID